jgi:hypothetical protein
VRQAGLLFPGLLRNRIERCGPRSLETESYATLELATVGLD